MSYVLQRLWYWSKTTISVFLAITSLQSYAQSFVVENGQILLSGGTLMSPGDTALIRPNGQLITTTTAITNLTTDVTITNYGLIETTTNNSHGIYSVNGIIDIRNLGVIRTSGMGSLGLYIDALNSATNNSGQIITTGLSADAVWLTRDNASLTNTGLVATTGDNSRGIYLQSNSSTLVNNGTIRTLGQFSVAISSSGTNSTLVNAGTISASGNNTAALDISGDLSIINNYGLIKAVGQNTYAILGNAGSQTVNLYKGSNIVGDVDLGAGIDTVNIMGELGSSIISFRNAENININIPGAILIGNSVISVDTRRDRAQSFGMAKITAIVSDALHTKYTTNYTSLVNHEDNEGKSIWILPLYSDTTLSEPYETASYKHRLGAVVIGGPLPVKEGENYLNWLAGVSNSSIVGLTEKSSSSGLFAGISRVFRKRAWSLHASLMLGIDDINSERKITNNTDLENVSSNNHLNYFLSPSLAISSSFHITPQISIRPSLISTITYGRFSSSKETNSITYKIDFHARHAFALSNRVQLELTTPLMGGSLGLKAGLQNDRIVDYKSTANLMGRDFILSTRTLRELNGTYVGAKYSLISRNNLNISINLEKSKSGQLRDSKSGTIYFSRSI